MKTLSEKKNDVVDSLGLGNKKWKWYPEFRLNHI